MVEPSALPPVEDIPFTLEPLDDAFDFGEPLPEIPAESPVSVAQVR